MHDPSLPITPEPRASATWVLLPQADALLQHLFRRYLRQGRLHPLYPLLQRYRSTLPPVSAGVIDD